MPNPFVAMTWVDRSVQYPDRRKITNTADQTDTKEVAVELAEGTVYAQGTPYVASTFNNLEVRIYNAFEAITREFTGTLTAGNTSLVISDVSITTSTRVEGVLLNVDPFSTGIAPTSCTVANGSVTLTFEALSFDLDVIVEVRG